MIAEAWKDYALRVMPADVSKVQLQETRRAFYAGARSFLNGLLEGLGVGDEPTAPDMRLMDAAVAELEAFAKDVAEGRA